MSAATVQRWSVGNQLSEAAGVRLKAMGYSAATAADSVEGAFTHTAYNDFEIVAANLLDGESRQVSQRLAGYALYIDPPLGRIGMTDAEAAKSGRRLLHAKRAMTRASAVPSKRARHSAS